MRYWNVKGSWLKQLTICKSRGWCFADDSPSNCPGAEGVHTHLWTLQLGVEQDEGRGWKEAHPVRWGSAFYHATSSSASTFIPSDDWLNYTKLRGSCNAVSHDPVVYHLCKTPRSSRGTWAFPPGLSVVLTHWTFCFMGSPQPQQIKTANIASTNRNCNNQVLSLVPQVVNIHLSNLILSFTFFPL